MIREEPSDSEKELFFIENSKFKIFEFDSSYFNIFLRIAAILSFLTPDAQKLPIIQNMILFKIVNQYQTNILQNDRYNNKIEKFTLDFITLNNFSTDFDNLFDSITLKELLFGFFAHQFCHIELS